MTGAPGAGPVSRTVVAQQVPRACLGDFPAYRLVPGVPLFRAHLSAHGPWWFSSDGGGRFDLPPPHGTCYLATNPAVAVRERLGTVLGGSASVPASLLEGVVVSRLRLPVARRLANLQVARAADFGVTRELETMVPYAVPHAWARALSAAGLEGLRYGPRFTPGAASSVALFGAEGAHDLPADPDPRPAGEVLGAPTPVPAPRRMDVTVVRPPRTRAARR